MMNNKTIRWNIYLPLLFILFSMLLFGSRNFDEAQSSPINIMNIHRLVLIPLTIALIVLFFLKKGSFKKNIPINLKFFSGYIIISLVSSLMFSGWVGYSLWKFLEIFSVFFVGLYVWNLSTKYESIGIKFYELIIKYYKFLLFFTLLGALIFPSQGIISANITHKAFLPYTIQGTIFKINPNSLGLMASIIFYISFIRINFRVKKAQFLNMNNIWLLLSLFVLILAQSRTAIAALLLSLVVYFFLTKKMKFYIKIIIFILFLILITLSLESIIEYLLRGTSVDRISSMSGRIYWWAAALEVFNASDLINQVSGLGYGTANRVILTDIGYGGAASLHSDYVDALISNGYLGVFFMISSILSTIYLLIRNFREYKYNRYFIEMSGIFFMFIVRSFTGTTFSLQNLFLILIIIIMVNIPLILKRVKMEKRSLNYE